MPIGQVIWFGGSTKEGRQNHYGFLSFIDGNTTKEIYVNRQEMPPALQSLLENDHERGKGVYVEFEFAKNGKERAINVRLHEFIGIITEFSKFGGLISCEDGNSVTFTHRVDSPAKFQKDDLLLFGIRYSSKKLEAIQVQKCEADSDNQQLIARCAQSSNPRIYKHFILKYISKLPQESAVDLLINKLKTLDSQEQAELLTNIGSQSENLLLQSADLRKYLRELPDSYAGFLNKHLHLQSSNLKQTLWSELLAHLTSCPQAQQQQLWSKVNSLEQNLEYRGNLWQIAPLQYQQKIIRERYQSFWELVNQFDNSEYPYDENITRLWKDIYQFDDLDRQLVNAWTKNTPSNDYEIAKMLSARGAEKLVVKFYQGLGYSVEDISIHQVTQESQHWIQGDIRINQNGLVDVKNARINVNSDLYSEFCVRKFKKTSNQSVKIVAVLSPYLQAKYIQKPETATFKIKNPVVLGEFNSNQLVQLESIFSDKEVVLNFSRSLNPEKYLPPWLFDYDERFYTKQMEIVTEFKQLGNHQIPTYEDLILLNACPVTSYLPIFIFSQRQLPENWLENLPSWLGEFLRILITESTNRLTLPHLFLSVLKHFLKMLSSNPQHYSPNNYMKILFSISRSYRHPLKIYDFLGLIRQFTETLQTVWENRNEANLKQFKVFKFTGQGLLQGKRSETDSNPTTILAYCGGWVESQGKCGYSPLIIGKHSNCTTCGRLICPECSYCSDNCPAYPSRKS